VINLDFSFAVAFYVIVVLGVIFALWIIARKEKDKDLSLDPKYIWFCSVCTYTYINTREEKISTCPRCGSYNKK